MSRGLLLGIDEGSTAVKAALFDCELKAVAEARRTLPSRHPHAGWVEQDPELILASVVDAVAEVLARAGGDEVLAAGLDHQGESVLAWDAHSGQALTPVISWQDKRHQEQLATLDPGAVERSGLPLDPYFSAGKLAWLLEHDQAVRGARKRGSLRLGTVDAFLCERLGARFASDLSTASRTQLLAVGGRDWDEDLLEVFGLRREWLPTLGPSFGELGELRHESWPRAIPLAAQLVDQQAALAGSGAVRPGELKATYGTGVFVLGMTAEPVRVAGLLPTVAWGAPAATGGLGDVAHALEGGVFAAGSLLDWLSEGLGLARDAPSLAAAARALPDSGGVVVLPALAGLGAPWWRTDARGVIAGLHRGVSAGHIGRAALEAIAARVADVVEAMAGAVPLRSLRVDGGLTREQTLLELQAAALDIPVLLGGAESTVLGAALLGGVGAGVFASVPEGAQLLEPPRALSVGGDPGERSRKRARWRAFVEAASRL